MVTMALPTRFRGFVDDSQEYASWLSDALEHIPELQYPLNIPVFGMMRKDAQIAAVLAGYTLQIRRASWAVDGAGCNPQVVKRVADDIGLPVAGEDKPGAARVRGVSWTQHLRSALLSLPYGHMGMEMLAELRDGKARLTALADRMPHTISEIHVDPSSGDFLGVSQDATLATLAGKPQIPADRMVWYAHEREGSSWQGRSLIRSAYGPWVFKRELQVILAQSSKRFGMGIPTIVWDIDPTPTQHADALRAVTAMRAGNEAGLVLPRGARLELAAQTGTTPDTLGFIKWLDLQIAKSAMMQHLDLGSTDSGSRALGETFVDVLMMAIQAEAEDLAEAFTRQVCARLVEWNEGTDEPVPRVVVSGIGDRHEVTAEALNSLLSSGALDADPAVKAFVRQKYGLPGIDPDAPVVAPGADLTKTEPVDPGTPADEAATAVAARQADLDWGLFGGGQPDTGPDDLDVTDDAADVDLTAFAP